MSLASKFWVFSVILCLLVMLGLGLSLVWLRIERVDLAYVLKQKQTELDSKESLVAKLVVERNTYLTPERLRQVAKVQGLGPVRPGQMRRMSEAGEEVPSPLAAKPEPKPEAKKSKETDKSGASKKKQEAGKSSRKEVAKVSDKVADKSKSKLKAGEVKPLAPGPKPEPVIEN